MKINSISLIAIIAIAWIIIIVIIAFALPLLGLQWVKFFKPKYENVNRQVFEQTKSYTHGVIQDLAKYFDEYQKATLKDKQVIQNTIKFRFAEFDANNIKSVPLKAFLINMRGY